MEEARDMMEIALGPYNQDKLKIWPLFQVRTFKKLHLRQKSNRTKTVQLINFIS